MGSEVGSANTGVAHNGADTKYIMISFARGRKSNRLEGIVRFATEYVVSRLCFIVLHIVRFLVAHSSQHALLVSTSRMEYLLASGISFVLRHCCRSKRDSRHQKKQRGSHCSCHHRVDL